ncbi:MAG: 50S ribosomal protein L30 [Deltaproteobacteria bacterium]|jgi:large subunit ribosomal protein L30|nr:50S ribosomal protein L30 [Deltaproteobacteria bacterium]
MNKLNVTLVKSTSGRVPTHRRTVRALGLRRVGHTVVHNATDPIKGMVKQVSYLLKVVEFDEVK